MPEALFKPQRRLHDQLLRALFALHFVCRALDVVTGVQTMERGEACCWRSADSGLPQLGRFHRLLTPVSRVL